MLRHSDAFTVGETHGILWRKEHAIERSSDSLGWSSLYVSMQREQPYADSFRALDDHLIIVHRDGPVRITRRLDGRLTEKVVPAGGLFILPAGQEFWVELGGSLSTIHLYLRAQMIEEAAAELCKGGGNGIELLPRLGEQDGLIEHAAYAACELMRERVVSDWPVESLARTIAVQLLRKHSTAMPASENTACGLSKERMHTITAFIEARFATPISLADMAEAVALSPIHFARQFKRSFEETPHQYLLARRVAAARRLLRTDLSIAEIAYRCGFSHQEHLTRMFRRLTGTTPGAFRRDTHG